MAKRWELVYEITNVLVRKRAFEGNGRETIIDQATWLQNLPNDVKKHFPEVLTLEITDEFAEYTMPFYEGFKTIKELLFNPTIPQRKIYCILEHITDFMFKSIYQKDRKRPSPNFIQQTHIERIKKRLKETSNKSSIFREIINIPHVCLNGECYKNILLAVQEIEKNQDLLNSLKPVKISMCHGDLHFDNIMVKFGKDKNFDFILLDPRGFKSGCDLCYDLGKLWHSFHGLYDLIHSDNFSLTIDKRNSKRIETTLKVHDGKLLQKYNWIGREFPNILEKYTLIKQDQYWQRRTLFSEASHFCSVVPFHLAHDGREHRAIALYLTGVRLINEFINSYT